MPRISVGSGIEYQRILKKTNTYGGKEVGIGRGGGSVTTLIYDTFTNTNGTALASHTIAPTNTPATSWTVDTGTMQIQSNSARAITGNELFKCDAGVADCTILATVRTGNSGRGNVGIVARYSNSTHYWLVYLGNDDNKIYLFEQNAGFVVRASTATTIADTTDYAAKLVCSGTALAGYLDGVQQVTYTSSFNQSATKAGGYADLAPTVSYQQWDDYKVTVP